MVIRHATDHPSPPQIPEEEVVVIVENQHRNGHATTATNSTGTTTANNNNYSTNRHNDSTVKHDKEITMIQPQQPQRQQQQQYRDVSLLSNTALEHMARDMLYESQQLSLGLTEQLSSTNVSGQQLLHTMSSLLNTTTTTSHNNNNNKNSNNSKNGNSKNSNNSSIPQTTQTLIQTIHTPLLSHTCHHYEQTVIHPTMTHGQQLLHDCLPTTIRHYMTWQHAMQFVQDIHMVEQQLRSSSIIINNTTTNNISIVVPSPPSQQVVTTTTSTSSSTSTKTMNGRKHSDDDSTTNDTTTSTSTSTSTSTDTTMITTWLETANTLERLAMTVMTLSETLVLTTTQPPPPPPLTTTTTDLASPTNPTIMTTNGTPPPLPPSSTTTTTTTSVLDYEPFLQSCRGRIRQLEYELRRHLRQQFQVVLSYYHQHQMMTTTTMTMPPTVKDYDGDTNTDNERNRKGVTNDTVAPKTNENDEETQQQMTRDSRRRSTDVTQTEQQQQQSTSSSLLLLSLLSVLGHIVRGFLVLPSSHTTTTTNTTTTNTNTSGSELEQLFVEIAIRPLLTKYINLRTMELLYGGTRGECTHLRTVLQSFVNDVARLYHPFVSYMESMLSTPSITIPITSSSSTTSPLPPPRHRTTIDVDFITMGIWVPLLQTFLLDPTMKRSIFSPGIASIVQMNYTILVEETMYHLAHQLLVVPQQQQQQGVVSTTTTNDTESRKQEQYILVLSKQQIRDVQERIYDHPVTNEFMKRWNLPIYYQLRFGECCTRMNTIFEQTKLHGWSVTIATTTPDVEEKYTMIRQRMGLELLLFLEFYDTIATFWQSHVFIRPLTNRFLRGTIQVLGRLLAFIKEGMDGKVLFGADEVEKEVGVETEDHNNSNNTQDTLTNSTTDIILSMSSPPLVMTRKPYCWGESESDVASVMWELSVLETAMRNDFVTVVCDALVLKPTLYIYNDDDDDVNSNETTKLETKELVKDILTEASEQIIPVIDHGWNDLIVNMLISKCSRPLGAVKGVAATYRMTNRPPPTMSSPFVATILRPLRAFGTDVCNRIPTHIGTAWKQTIVSTISDRYAIAVDDLIVTVQRAEESLLKRKGGRAMTTNIRSGGVTMSDGEKVKLQLYLDYVTYIKCVQDVGIDPFTIDGIIQLGKLTQEGETLQQAVVSK